VKRWFHVVYTILALNFLIPAALYAVAPDFALQSFWRIGDLFGVPYLHSEDSVFWRVLAVANVAMLGFTCVLLQVDVKKYQAALYPLVFLNAMASLGFGVAFLFEPYPGYLAAFLLDGATLALMIIFARGALREVEARQLSET